uniref:Uncharacterized protein n=1 Tax=Prolemur simus TaxID=1328070 RepID=A0A8C8ZGI4_PROSS
MEDSHKCNTSETAPQPGSAVQGALDSTLPLPQMEPYSWPVQAQMEYKDFRH